MGRSLVKSAIDFETTDVGYFEKRSKCVNWQGHPRLVRPTMLAYYDGKNVGTEKETNKIRNFCSGKNLIAHNISFDGLILATHFGLNLRSLLCK